MEGLKPGHCTIHLGDSLCSESEGGGDRDTYPKVGMAHVEEVPCSEFIVQYTPAEQKAVITYCQVTFSILSTYFLICFFIY